MALWCVMLLTSLTSSKTDRKWIVIQLLIHSNMGQRDLYGSFLYERNNIIF